MKKLLLFTFTLLLLSVLTARPLTLQSIHSDSNYILSTDTLELYDTLGNIINNSTIRITSSDPDVDPMVGHIWFKNTTNTEMPNVKVRRIINQEVEGSMNTFCFGTSCYGPSTDESPVADTAKVGIINKSFYADYSPNQNGGITSITYEFFDSITFGVRVSAKATIEFHLSANSINEDKLVFKGPYPNPASLSVNFEYNLPATVRNARLIIRNLLGVEMENIAIETRSGKKSIDVNNFASGIYFYSLILDGKVIQSKKMIVKH